MTITVKIIIITMMLLACASQCQQKADAGLMPEMRRPNQVGSCELSEETSA